MQSVKGVVRKAEKLREMLEESEELQELRCPLPLDPSIHLAGIIPQECSVFKSALSPLRLTFRTTGYPPPPLPHSLANFIQFVIFQPISSLLSLQYCAPPPPPLLLPRSIFCWLQSTQYHPVIDIDLDHRYIL